MANEITVRSSITINKNNLQFRWPFQGSFQDDLNSGKGPSPGYLDIPTTGRDIYFTELTNPSWCIFANLENDNGNYFEYGIYDVQTRIFFPLGEVGPGQVMVLKLSRNLMEEYSQSGTGTTEPQNYLRVRAGTPGPEPSSGGTVKGFVGAFEL